MLASHQQNLHQSQIVAPDGPYHPQRTSKAGIPSHHAPHQTTQRWAQQNSSLIPDCFTSSHSSHVDDRYFQQTFRRPNPDETEASAAGHTTRPPVPTTEIETASTEHLSSGPADDRIHANSIRRLTKSDLDVVYTLAI
ncbi:hypothetical protein I302_100050 [Kwoniella bestiolae CBS 10118]|uniref:Uncharacterized protein n=1 Tax=Kwoniella bestiolae CBS 10118 TaxID=1296100 RepID=A0A1B9G3Y9_9TREE|nr:hypothetical protein I302_03422 [Kwoniella bestiolae CBS 10118]OCF25749.1 hypothetical protein I302_03422 [Kwoniella bestiolae CBS 10118]